MVLYCDISDFYNQIHHHIIENQLSESGFPNQAAKYVVKLLESTTAGVSRGVTIGPHAVQLVAEATLIPIDNSMDFSGLNFLDTPMKSWCSATRRRRPNMRSEPLRRYSTNSRGWPYSAIRQGASSLPNFDASVLK